MSKHKTLEHPTWPRISKGDKLHLGVMDKRMTVHEIHDWAKGQKERDHEARKSPSERSRT